jgi:AraC-like DNA-binding protein
MDFSTINNLPEYREEKFRTPFATERKLGLWIDRIGKGITSDQRNSLRKLGQYAIIAIESGSGTLLTKSAGCVHLNAGDVFIHLPEEPTRYYPNTTWTQTWIVFNGPDTTSLEQTGLLASQTIIIKNAAQIVASAYEKLSRIITAESLASVLKRKIILLDAITALYQTPRNIENPIQSLITQTIEYISENATAKTSVPQLAERCGLSETHFRRVFKQYTGRTPKDHILAAQISKAKQLLAMGHSIKQTAAIIDYDDVCYFMRIFKKHTTLTAAQFQRLFNMDQTPNQYHHMD